MPGTARLRLDEERKKRSKTLGSSSGAMPMPLSVTRSCTCPPTSAASIAMLPPGGVNLHRVAHEVAEDLLHPGGIGQHVHAQGRPVDPERDALALADGRERLAPEATRRARPTGAESTDR